MTGRGAVGRQLTMEDVAHAAGVSRSLVSIVLRGQPGASEATRARVFEVARELGYQPNAAASRLARSSSATIGVAFTLRNAFHTSIVEGIYTAAEAAGFDVILSGAGPARPEADAVATLIAGRCAGAVLLGSVLDGVRLGELNQRLPLVVVGDQAKPLVCDCVYTDDRRGVRLGLDHLDKLGHTAIAYATCDRGFAMAAREAAYLEWMEHRGLAARACLLPGSDTEQGGLIAGDALLDLPELPTAVLCANDRCALGLLARLRTAGVDVPGRVSVMGFDDIDMSQYGSKPLTTVHQDSVGLAISALEALTERIVHPEREPQAVVLEPSLRLRLTTAPPVSA